MSPRETKIVSFTSGLFLLAIIMVAVSIGSSMTPAIVLMYCLGVWVIAVGVTVHEHSKSWKRTLNPRLASWAYLADPLLAVSGAAFALARPVEMVSPRTWLASLAVAWTVAGVSPLVVRALDRPRYRRHKAEHAFNATGKIVHDFATTTVLAGTNVVLGGWALLDGRFNVWFWIGVSCVVPWALCLVKDSVLKWEPNPLDQYPLQTELRKAESDGQS